MLARGFLGFAFAISAIGGLGQSVKAKEVLVQIMTIERSEDNGGYCTVSYCHPAISSGCEDFTSPMAYGAVDVIARGQHYVKVKVIRSFHSPSTATGTGDCSVGDIGIHDAGTFDLDVKNTREAIDAAIKGKNASTVNQKERENFLEDQ